MTVTFTTGLPWFSADLTNLVQPLVPGRVYVVLAPTGTGKTVFGLNVVDRLLHEEGVQVCVAATEETTRYLELLACRATSASYADYFYGRLDDKASGDVARWATAYREEPRLHLLAQRAPTLEQLLEAFQQHGTPHVLVVDHLHCLGHGGYPLPVALELAMTTLSEIAGQLEVAVVAMAQVHRPPTRDPLYPYRIPTVSAGMGSSKIEQQADVILGLSRKLRDDTPAEALARLAKGLLKEHESVRDYEDAYTARVTVLKHRMDDNAARRSVLLTVRDGYMRDRLALVPDEVAR